MAQMALTLNTELSYPKTVSIGELARALGCVSPGGFIDYVKFETYFTFEEREKLGISKGQKVLTTVQTKKAILLLELEKEDFL